MFFSLDTRDIPQESRNTEEMPPSSERISEVPRDPLQVPDSLEDGAESNALSNVAWIRQRLSTAFPGALIQVEDTRGDDQHLCATIISGEFSGKTRIACHQRVYAALDHMRGGHIHALALKTQSCP